MELRGRPPVPRAVRARFWEGVRSGLGWQDAAVAAGVPAGRAGVVPGGWRGEGDGAGPVSGRYLSLAEREEIAVGLAAGDGVRVIAARLGRAPSTVSREVRRNCLSPGAGTGRWRRSGGRRTGRRGRRRRSSPATMSCAAGCRAGCGNVVAGAGRRRLRRSSRTVRRCGCRTRRSTSRCIVQGRGGAAPGAGAGLRTGRALRRPRRHAGERRGKIPGMVQHQRATGRGRRPGGARALGRRPDRRQGRASPRSARWWSAPTRYTMLAPMPGGKPRRRSPRR